MLVMVSGPPRAGKNTLVKGLLDYFNHPRRDKKHAYEHSISKPMKELGHKLLENYLPPEFMLDCPDKDKDKRQDCLNGHSFRDLYVHIGQLDTFAPALWAHRCADGVLELARRIERNTGGDECGIHVIESVGKQGQFDALRRHPIVSQLQHTLLIHLSSPGFDYTDNRTPIVVTQEHRSPTYPVHELSLVNDRASDKMCRQAVGVIDQIHSGKY